MNLEQYERKIEKWFSDRGLEKASPYKQMLKLIEEFGELASGIAKNDEDVIKDSIGDIFVVYTGLMHQLKMQSENLPNLSEDVVMVDMLYALRELGRIADKLLCLNDDNVEDIMKKDVKIVRGRIQSCLVGIESDITNIAELYETDLESCVAGAYKEIKDRRGKMINGVFVKESDLVDSKI